MKIRWCAAVARIILVFSFTAACGQATALAQEDPTVGRIISIDPRTPSGKLKVKQKRGEQYVDATVGMPVRRGYMLKLATGARATIYCANGATHELLNDIQGCPCAAASRSVIYQGSSIPKGRGQDTASADFPVVLSPRMNMLLTTRPTIRWSAAAPAGADAPVTYRVSMYTGTDELVWRVDGVAKTEMTYPPNEEELVRGETYKVLIEAGTKSSAQERDANINFTVLPEVGAASVLQGEEAIRKLNLPAAQTALLTAELYATRALTSEAVEKMTAAAEAIREPSVLRMLGDLYSSQRLFREAVEQYEAVLALPQLESDPEAKVLTLIAEGYSLEALGETGRAASRFNRAVDVYRKLGEKVSLEDLRSGKMKW